MPAPPRRLHTLLAIMVITPSAHPRDRLAAVLRPDLPVAAARRRLNHLLWVLRDNLPSLRLESDRDTVAIAAGSRTSDVEDFRRAAQGETLESWRTAYHLYDDLMPDCDHPWMESPRQDLQREFIAVVRRACPQLLIEGAPEEAREMARRARTMSPLDEPIARLQMQAHEMLGQRRNALSVFEELRLAAQALDLALDLETVRLADHLRSRTCPATPRRDGAVANGSRVSMDGTLTARLLEADMAAAAGDDEFAARVLLRCDHPQARVRLAAISRRRGNIDEAWKKGLTAAVEIAEEDDEGAHSFALTELAWTASALGDAGQAIRSADTAVQLARAAGSRRLECRSLLARGGEELREGRIAQAMETLLHSAGIAGTLGLAAEHGEALHLISAAHRRLGRLDAAIEHHDAALVVWQRLGNPRGIAEALIGTSLTLLRAGQHGRAVAAVKRAVTTLQTSDPPGLLLADCQLAIGSIALARDGCGAEAATVLELCRHPVLATASRSHSGRRARLATLRGTALHLAGDHAGALTELVAARTLHAERGELPEIPPLLALHALVHLAGGEHSAAEASADEALQLSATGSQEPDTAPLIYYAKGAVLRARGRHREGSDVLRRGYRSLREISATTSKPADVLQRDVFSRALAAAAGERPARDHLVAAAP